MQPDEADSASPQKQPASPQPPPLASLGSPITANRARSLRKKFEDFETAPAGPAQGAAVRGKRLGDILAAMGLLTPEQVQLGADQARLYSVPIGQYLVRRYNIAPEQLCRALSLQSGLPVVDLSDPNNAVAAGHRRFVETMRRFGLAPFNETSEALCVAAQRSPTPQQAAEIEKAFGKPVRFFLAPDEQIDAVLKALGEEQAAQRRNHPRHRITMPAWLQLCNERNESLGARHGGQILDISIGGLRVEAPERLMAELKLLRRGEPHVLVRFSTPPLEVHGSCVVRYTRKFNEAKAAETRCVLGLQIKTLGPAERESFRKLNEGAKIATRRLDSEFGIDSDE